MNSFIDKLTVLGLQRLYKFVLKRVLGEYLVDEILLEQLTVESKNGFVIIRDLNIDTEKINTLLIGLPFVCKCATISMIEIKVSYANLFTEGCIFNIKGVNIVIEPLSSVNSGDMENSLPAPKASSSKAVNVSKTSERTDDGGLDFVAEWIEVVVARTQVTVEDINITVYDAKAQHDIEHTSLVVSIKSISFFNTHPQDIETVNSNVSLSTKNNNGSFYNSSTGTSAYASSMHLLGTRKLLRCEGFEVDIVRVGNPDFVTPVSSKPVRRRCFPTPHLSYSSVTSLSSVQSASVSSANASASTHTPDMHPNPHSPSTPPAPVNPSLMTATKRVHTILHCHGNDTNGHCSAPLMVQIRQRKAVPYSSAVARSSHVDIDVSQGGVISCPLDTTSITSFLQLASAFVSKPVGDTGRHTSPHPQQGGAHALEDPDPVGPTRGTMRWLENLCRLPHPPNTTHTDADSEDGIDYDKLNALLAKYQEAREGMVDTSTNASMGASSHSVLQTTVSVESDSEDDFPLEEEQSDVEDMNSTMFKTTVVADSHKANNTMGKSVRFNVEESGHKSQKLTVNSSVYGASTMHSNLFHSAVSQHPSSAPTGAPTGDTSSPSVPTIHLRVHLKAAVVSLEDNTHTHSLEPSSQPRVHRAIELKLEEMLFIHQMVPSPSDVSSSNSSFSIAMVSLNELCRTHSSSASVSASASGDDVHATEAMAMEVKVNPWITFSESATHNIIAPPHVQIECNTVTGGKLHSACRGNSSGKLVTSINLEPVLVCVDLTGIAFWANVMAKALSCIPTSSSSTTYEDITLQLPLVEVIIYADATAAAAVWEDEHGNTGDRIYSTLSKVLPSHSGRLGEEGSGDSGKGWQTECKKSRWQECKCIDPLGGGPKGGEIGRRSKSFLNIGHAALVLKAKNVRVSTLGVGGSQTASSPIEGSPMLSMESICADMIVRDVVSVDAAWSESGVRGQAEARPRLPLWRRNVISAFGNNDRMVSISKVPSHSNTMNSNPSYSGTNIQAPFQANVSSDRRKSAYNVVVEDDTSSLSEDGDNLCLAGCGLVFPQVSAASKIFIDSQQICMDVLKSEYDLFLVVCGVLSAPADPASPTSSEPSTATRTSTSGSALGSAGSSNATNNTNAGFSVKFTSETATIRIAEDVTGEGEVEAAQLSYVLAIREPTIEFVSVLDKVFVGIKAKDLSAFEIPFYSLYHCNDSSEYKPFLHRTTLHCSWNNPSDSTGISPSHPNVFNFQLMLSDEPPLPVHTTGSAAAKVKVMELHLLLQDVTLSYDPLSTWLLNVVSLLSPTKIPVPSSPPSASCPSTPVASQSNATISGSKSESTPFQITKISVLVSRFMVDYKDSTTPSRCLFSVGLLSLAANIVSNSPKIGLKFSVHDVALHLSNVLLEGDAYEQSPLDIYGARIGQEEQDTVEPSGGIAGRSAGQSVASFYRSQSQVLKSMPKAVLNMDRFIDIHHFVQLCTLDSIQLLLVLNDHTGTVLSVTCTLGNCCLYACMDSLDILVRTGMNWWDVFKPKEAKEDIVIVENNLDEGNDKAEEQASCAMTSFMSLPVTDPGTSASATDGVKGDGVPTNVPVVSNPSWMDDVTANAFAPRSPTGPTATVAAASALAPNTHMTPHIPSIPAKYPVIVPPAAAQEEEHSTSAISEAVIENFYTQPEYEKAHDRADSPEYTARWLPQYDDNSDDEGTVGGYYPQCANGGMAMSMFNDSRLQSNVDDGFEVYDDGEEDGSLQDGLMHNSQSAVIATGVLPTDSSIFGRQSEMLEETSSSKDSEGSSDSEGIDLDDLESEEEEERIPQEKFGFKSLSLLSMSMSVGYAPGTSAAASKSGMFQSMYTTHPAVQEEVELGDFTGRKLSLQRRDSGLAPHGEEEDVLENRGDPDVSDVSSFSQSSPPSLLMNAHGNEVVSPLSNLSMPTLKDTSTRQGRSRVEVVEDEDTDFQRAWTTQDQDISSSTAGLDEADQRAQWYSDAHNVEILPHHIPLISAQDVLHVLSKEESKLTPTVLVSVNLSVRCRIFGGCDWGPVGRKGAEVAPSAPPRQLDKKITELVSDTTPAPSRSSSLFAASEASASRAGSTDTGIGSSATAVMRTRELQEMLELSVTDSQVYFRIYPKTAYRGGSPGAYSEKATRKRLPSERFMCNAKDIVVSFAQIGRRRRKIFGANKTNATYNSSKRKPPLRDVNQPMISCVLLGYCVLSDTAVYGSVPRSVEETENVHQLKVQASHLIVEHRLFVNIIPLRAYLDGSFISFVKDLIPASSSSPATDASDSTPSVRSATPAVEHRPSIYFQYVQLSSIDIKIDYLPNPVNFGALKEGDFLQLLNIFPLDGLEITLKQIKLTGISGGMAVIGGLAAEAWVKDIYSNQMHRILSGTAPFRGISNIGSGLQDLVLMPMKDYKQTGGIMRGLQQGTSSLLHTITRETLHATHQLTMMLAHGIADLATESSSNTHRAQQVHRQRIRQPDGLHDTLDTAYETMSREVNAAVETVVVLPIKQYHRTGGTNTKGYVKEVICALPVAVLRPLAGATEALSYTLLGLRNHIDPASQRDEEDMWNI